MRTFSRILKMVSALTLFFFCWTYMPLYAAVAWAAEPPRVRNMERADRVGVKDGNTVALVQRPEEKFEKALEAVREKIDKAQEKLALRKVEGRQTSLRRSRRSRQREQRLRK